MSTWVKVAEAATLTGKSKQLIYQLIEQRRIHTEESSTGMVLNLAELNRVLATRRRPGRPRRDTPTD